MTVPPAAGARYPAAILVVMAAVLAQACGDGTAPAPVDTIAPAVDLSLSSGSVSTPGPISLMASASDQVGVTKVEFYERIAGSDADPTKIGEDISPPYAVERPIMTVADNGSYEFTAKAYDAAGNVGTSNAETATVNLEGVPPAFTISASDDHITTPGRITFAADATAGLTRMEIYEHGVKVGENTGSTTPPSVAVEVSNRENGSRVYVARGFGDSGEIGFSNQLPISIDIRWDVIRALEGMSAEYSLQLASDASGAAYVATTTRTESNAVIDLNVILSKYDHEGNQSWTRTFGGTDWESLYSVGVDQSGRVYLSGHIHSQGEGETRNPDCFLALYDASGSHLWTRLIETPLLDVLCVTTSGPAGDFYVAGVVEEGNSRGGRTDVFVSKYDPAGNQVWRREFGSGPGFLGDDILTSIAVDPLEGVYVTGYTSGVMEGTTNQGGRDIFVVKVDRNGNRLWSRQYGTDYHDFGNSLAADPEGGVYVAGGRDHPDFRFGRYGDALLLRYSPDGTLLWNRQLDGGYFDDAWDVVADQGGVRLVGTTGDGSSGQLTERTQGPSDAFLASLSPGGDLLSARLLGGPERDGATGLALGLNGDAYVVLTTEGGLPGIPTRSAALARHREIGP
jgi:hypothetical protein